MAEFSQEHGFRLVQINLDNPRHFPERIAPRERAEVRARFNELGIGLCFHGPSDLTLMNRHEKIHQAGLDRAREMIDLAIDMGGEYFILHPGRLAFYSLSTKKVFFMEQRYPERISATFARSLGCLLAYCAGRIRLCIENTHAFSTQFLKVIGELASKDGLGLVWDVAHTEQLSGARRIQLIKFFQDNIKQVRLAHLHDIVDGAVHKPLGTGRLDVAGYLEIFNAMGIDIILEIFPEEGLIKSVEYLKTLVVTDKLN